MELIRDDFDWMAYEIEDEKPKVIPASSLTDAVLAKFFNPESSQGDFFPWDKFQLKGLRIRAGEVSVYAGINGHYKSQIASQIALGLLSQSTRVLIASFEMPVVDTMERMVKQAAGNAEPSVGYVKRFHRWTDDRLWLYDHHGGQQSRKVIAVCRYAAKELGVKHVFIDSLMRCVRGADDYNAQKNFVDDLCSLAMQAEIHIHLVHHAKKQANELEIIDKFDIKGAGEIVDQAHNAFLIQRNKRREAKLEKGEDDDSPDVFFTVGKQRNGQYEGTVGMWRDGGSLSLVERPGTKPRGLTLERDAGEE